MLNSLTTHEKQKPNVNIKLFQRIFRVIKLHHLKKIILLIVIIFSHVILQMKSSTD